MAFDGNGTFVRLYSWVTDKLNGIPITASRVDGEDTGFAAGLSLCVTRDGQGQMTADFDPSVDLTYLLGSPSLRWLGLNAGILQATSTTVSAEGPIGGAQVDLTPDASAFTGTITGLTTTVHSNCKWGRVGNLVTLSVGAGTGVSNANTMTLTGLPTQIIPATLTSVYYSLPYAALSDNGNPSTGNASCLITAGGALQLNLNDAATGWTTSGTKGIRRAFQIQYLIL